MMFILWHHFYNQHNDCNMFKVQATDPAFNTDGQFVVIYLRANVY
jgi:hypothetical protein